MKEAKVVRQDWMTDEVYAWAVLEEQARINTLDRLERGGKNAIVAIKAQHPLNADGTPGPEYEQRLEKALDVGYQLQAKGLTVYYMTFGGVHEGHKTISLANSGHKWLIKHGVDQKRIHMLPVVFSGNDEDRLAAEMFTEGGEQFSELHVVMSAGQWERSRLYFIFCGWQPTFHAITFLDAKPNHSTVCELWGSWAVPGFAKGPDEIARITDEIRKKHLEAAMK